MVRCLPHKVILSISSDCSLLLCQNRTGNEFKPRNLSGRLQIVALLASAARLILLRFCVLLMCAALLQIKELLEAMFNHNTDGRIIIERFLYASCAAAFDSLLNVDSSNCVLMQ